MIYGELNFIHNNLFRKQTHKTKLNNLLWIVLKKNAPITSTSLKW